jgi:acetoacetyl-CoA synthetase
MSESPSDTERGDADAAVVEGAPLWSPSAERIEDSALTRYVRWLAETRGLTFADYPSLWTWSVSELEAFWESIWQFFDVHAMTPYQRVLGERRMPGARWFEGAQLNYAEHALRRRGDDPALIALAENGARSELSYAELAERVGRARAGLVELGVHKGDRVAAFLPNSIEAVVGLLASASLGAIWSSCSPEFGVGSVLDRFRQIEPKVLMAADGYEYGGKTFDRTAALSEIAAGLPSLEVTVVSSRLGRHRIDAGIGVQMISFDELCASAAPLTFEPVSFDHPLWVLYSSGTTGLPKPIVQGHGGILLEHFKALALHCDLGQGDRFFWFTTTGWMMWNFLVSGLLVGTTIVLYDGSPGHPDLSALWRMAAREGVTYFGTSAPFLMACRKAGIQPSTAGDLSTVKSIGTTGAPLPPEGFSWVYAHVGADLLLGSVSGGTDVCTAFVLSCPWLPVRSGELQCRGLGAKVEAFDEQGRSVVDQVGELVLTEPFPPMPLYLWGDADGRRYHDSYFSVYPGIWRHGDWIKIDAQGRSVIYGRSDATLNRGGVRMGTSEFYRVVDGVAEIADSLVVDTSLPGQPEGKLWLFVVLRPGSVWDDTLRKALVTRLKSELSPRHVPDEIHPVRELPRTLNGKKLEVPIKRILSGVDVEKAVNPDTLANPGALGEFRRFAPKG